MSIESQCHTGINNPVLSLSFCLKQILLKWVREKWTTFSFFCCCCTHKRLCGFTLKKKEASTGGGLGDKNWSSRMRFRGFDHHNGSLWFFRDYDEEEFRWKSRSRLFVVFCVGVSLVWEEHPMLTNYELTVEFDHRRKRYQRFFFFVYNIL